jgi:hypothetical protein
MIDTILLTAARICTFVQQRALTNASGFFFERGGRLFLVTSRHVMLDKPSRHFPDRLEIELHIDPDNMAGSTGFSIPLYRGGKSLWRQGLDKAGDIDVAVIEIERCRAPGDARSIAPSPRHTCPARSTRSRSAVLACWWSGFPLGFHDTLHHMPVVRQAVIASSYRPALQG